jgi:hypothetical protein
MDFDLPTAIIAVHTLVGFVFIGLGIQYLRAGRPMGLVLQGLLGVLVIGAGVAASRIVGDRD